MTSPETRRRRGQAHIVSFTNRPARAEFCLRDRSAARDRVRDVGTCRGARRRTGGGGIRPRCAAALRGAEHAGRGRCVVGRREAAATRLGLRVPARSARPDRRVRCRRSARHRRRVRRASRCDYSTQHTNYQGNGLDDEVTTYLWPGGTNGYRYAFSANALGTRFARSTVSSTFAPDFTVAARIRGEYYVVTMHIPFAVLRIDGHGAWRVQFGRTVVKTRSDFEWAHSKRQTAVDDVLRAGYFTDVVSSTSKAHRAVARTNVPAPSVQVDGVARLGTLAAGGVASSSEPPRTSRSRRAPRCSAPSTPTARASKRIRTSSPRRSFRCRSPKCARSSRRRARSSSIPSSASFARRPSSTRRRFRRRTMRSASSEKRARSRSPGFPITASHATTTRRSFRTITMRAAYQRRPSEPRRSCRARRQVPFSPAFPRSSCAAISSPMRRMARRMGRSSPIARVQRTARSARGSENHRPSRESSSVRLAVISSRLREAR